VDDVDPPLVVVVPPRPECDVVVEVVGAVVGLPLLHADKKTAPAATTNRPHRALRARRLKGVRNKRKGRRVGTTPRR
jgi:hypothetical protein